MNRSDPSGLGPRARLLVAATFAALGVLAAPALARSGVAGSENSAEAAANGMPSVAEFAARSITRIALMDLRDTPDPGIDDYTIASLLLGLAQDLLPDDLDLLRRRIEAAWEAGDQREVLRLTERLVELDPADTVAQLRLISSRIAQLQTAEERLRTYDNFLGPRGQALDAAVRSRLALDAALLHRERGEMGRFVERLDQAIRLDSTNKEAAALAATYFAERVDDRVGRLDLMANLLMADPVDPQVHLTIARELAAGGAFRAASRFHRNAQVITSQVAGELPEALGLEALILLWHTDGPRAVGVRLDRDLLAAKDMTARAIRDRLRNELPVDGLRRPEDVKLTPVFQRVRAIASLAAGDRTEAQAAAMVIDAEAGRVLQELRDPDKRPPGMTDQQVEQAGYITVADVFATRLWVEGGVEQIAKNLGENEALRSGVLGVMPDIDGWLALRTGDAAGAIEKLAPLADRSRFAQVGLGLAYEQLGRTDDAERLYRDMVKAGPLSLYGAWAATRLSSLLNVTNPLGDPAPLEEWATSVPTWVDRMLVEPQRFVRLTARLPDPTIEPTDRMAVQLVLQNIAPIPLAVGTGRALNSRILMVPKLEAHVQARHALARPEVVDLERRLRLMPREEIVATVWPDAGITGWLMECLSGQSIRIRWRAIQGFGFAPGGGYRPGVMCVETESGHLVRAPLLEAGLPAADLARKAALDAEHSLMRTATAIRGRLVGGRSMDGSPENWPAVMGALAQRYPTLSPEGRAMLLAVIPHARMTPPTAPLDQAAHSEEHPLPLAVYLVTRVTDPTDEALSRARESEDARVRRLADLVAARLGRDGRLYARLTAETMLAGVPPAPGQAPATGETPAPASDSPLGPAPEATNEPEAAAR